MAFAARNVKSKNNILHTFQGNTKSFISGCTDNPAGLMLFNSAGLWVDWVPTFLAQACIPLANDRVVGNEGTLV